MLLKLLSLNFIILLKQTFSCMYMQIKIFLCIYVKKNSKDLLSGYSEKLSGPCQVLKLGKYDLICSPSIHFVPLIRVGLGGQQPKKRSLDLSLPRSLLQLKWGNTKVFSDQSKDIITPVCQGFAPGLLLVGRAQDTLPKRCPGGILIRYLTSAASFSPYPGYGYWCPALEPQVQ